MKNPTKQQVQIVIDTLQKAKDGARKAKKRAPVEMVMGCNIVGYGKPMCHGAYYAKAKGLKAPDDFIDGAENMAQDLGFESRKELKLWARQNPLIWGNDCGGYMFTENYAFSTGDKELTDLQQIIDQWKGVQSRLSE